MLKLRMYDDYRITSLLDDFEVVKKQVGMKIFRSKELKKRDYNKIVKLLKYGLLKKIDCIEETRIIKKPHRNYYQDIDKSLINIKTNEVIDDIRDVVENEIYKAVEGKAINSIYYTYQLQYNTKQDFIEDLGITLKHTYR